MEPEGSLPHSQASANCPYNNNNNNNNNNNKFRKYVSNIPGNHEVKELQKTAILGTAHTLRKVLM